MRKQSLIGFAVSVTVHLAAAVVLVPDAPAFRPMAGFSVTRSDTGVTPLFGTMTSTHAVERFADITLRVERLTATRSWRVAGLLNHLWQSTIIALVVALLTIVFRKNAARVRYWLWFSASVKFLVPFSLLIVLGTSLPWPSAAPDVWIPDWSLTVAQMGQRFVEGQSIMAASTADHASGIGQWAGLALVAIWACGCAAVLLRRSVLWSRIQEAVRHSAPMTFTHVSLPNGVRLRGTDSFLEPAVVGLWRPIVLLPIGIDQHLTPAQLEAVLAHEVCHIRRRDNLSAALHMTVEAVFWFHPVVWWIGGRLLDERERACDEEVLRTTSDPRAYADGIVKVCKRYVNARLAYVAGVGGSDLRKRIEAIMRQEIGEPLNAWKAGLLGTIATAIVTMPIAVGALNAPPPQAQSTSTDHPAFEVASIRPNTSGELRRTLIPQPGGRLTATNVTTMMLIHYAYDRPAFQVFGGPDWISSDRFDVLAKAEGDPPVGQKRLMLRRLLAERFGLVVHTETRQIPVYELVLSRGDRRLGPQLRASAADCAGTERTSDGVGPAPSDGPPICGYFGFSPGTKVSSGRGGLGIRGMTMSGFARSFAPMVGRTVLDRTRLAGYFDADFDFVAELPAPPPPPGVPNPFSEPFLSIFTVLPEQLGLKLESGRGPVEVLIVDGATRPTPD